MVCCIEPGFLYDFIQSRTVVGFLVFMLLFCCFMSFHFMFFRLWVAGEEEDKFSLWRGKCWINGFDFPDGIRWRLPCSWVNEGKFALKFVTFIDVKLSFLVQIKRFC